MKAYGFGTIRWGEIRKTKKGIVIRHHANEKIRSKYLTEYEIVLIKDYLKKLN